MSDDDYQQIPLGALPDPPDPRRFRLEALVAPRALAPRIDRDSSFPPARNQGQLGSCVAFAFTAAQEWHDHQELGTWQDLSEMFLYDQCKSRDGWPGEGTYPYVATDVLRQRGVCAEAYWPYVAQYPPGTKPDDEAWTDCAQHKAWVTASVQGGIDGMKAALELGPVPMMAEIWGSFYKTPSLGYAPMPSDGLRGYHQMCRIGYDDDKICGPYKGAFRDRNSWGAWGGNPKGLFWTPYETWVAFGMGGFAYVDAGSLPSRWSDWPESSAADCAAGEACFVAGVVKGYTDGSLRYNSPVLMRHVALIAARIGITGLTDYESSYLPAIRGWVRDVIPGLQWKGNAAGDMMWDATLTRYQLTLLVGRYLLGTQSHD